MSAEGSFKLIDPLAYHVNNIEDFDPKIVKAHKTKDSATISEMTQNGQTAFDVFICINTAWHAFILCIPNTINDPLGIMSDIPQDDPFQVPEQILCWTFELGYENEQLKLYKIKKEVGKFGGIKNRVNKAYHIGRYKDIRVNAFEFAALRAAPHRYNVLLNDCVEFAKEFCLCLLSYCSNYRKLEREVEERIKAATATGLSIERLSRRVRSSAWIGNTFLGGLEGSLFFSGRNGSVVLIMFMLVCPIVVSCFTSALIIYYLK